MSFSWKKEKCVDCGAEFEQWEWSHLEQCPLCRIAHSLRRFIDLKEEGF